MTGFGSLGRNKTLGNSIPASLDREPLDEQVFRLEAARLVTRGADRFAGTLRPRRRAIRSRREDRAASIAGRSAGTRAPARRRPVSR